jgi:hypothetical protein
MYAVFRASTSTASLGALVEEGFAMWCDHVKVTGHLGWPQGVEVH